MTSKGKYPSLIDSHDYVYDFPDYPPHAHHVDHEEQSSRRRLPIPDLRFEQTYLSRIRTCIHIESAAQGAKEKQKEPTESAEEEEATYIAATHVNPLINSSQQVVRVDWGKVAYITLRDQVMMPLLQGMLWGIIGTYYRPLVNLAKDSLQGKPLPTHPVEGEGVGWLRSWVKKLGLSNITVGPLNFQGQS
ncbi:hypothetical protein HYDPIDRAFT_115728 [Hydnomerulius pinastri MD-312]|uniref:Uncharacterized protein n=1 Tax=Hydnomerulius pinastri MD-312 TaxID=994086 RepID=A0A0C9WBW6_9AGAM|nr:hypothetical protein HYDPIDRAFT_115728 [Hydnomerulius pinastri MD-312]